jgi:hypothetical protein
MSRVNPLIRCVCGQEFPNRKSQRYHIAVVTDRWPIDRCSPEHHDPDSYEDLRFLGWRKIREEFER